MGSSFVIWYGTIKIQAEKAGAYIRKAVTGGESCFINNIVLCELVWVLESAYEYDKEAIADVLERILATKQFELERKDITRQAVHDYKEGRDDLAEDLLGRINQALGCVATVSFDRALKNTPSFIMLD